jgi:hypothetical protein
MFLEIKCVGTDLPDFVGYFVSLIYIAIRIGIPILLIIVGMFDMGKAIVAKKEEDVKKAQSLLVRKLVVGLIVFLLPYFVELVVKLATRDQEVVDCMKRLIDYRTNLFK